MTVSALFLNSVVTIVIWNDKEIEMPHSFQDREDDEDADPNLSPDDVWDDLGLYFLNNDSSTAVDPHTVTTNMQLMMSSVEMSFPR